MEIVCLIERTASGVNSSPSRSLTPQSSCLKFFVRHSPPGFTRFTFVHCVRLALTQHLDVGTALVTQLRTRTVFFFLNELVLLPRVITTLDHLKTRVPLIDDVVHLAAQVVVLHLASNLVELRLARASNSVACYVSGVT